MQRKRMGAMVTISLDRILLISSFVIIKRNTFSHMAWGEFISGLVFTIVLVFSVYQSYAVMNKQPSSKEMVRKEILSNYIAGLSLLWLCYFLI